MMLSLTVIEFANYIKSLIIELLCMKDTHSSILLNVNN